VQQRLGIPGSLDATAWWSRRGLSPAVAADWSRALAATLEQERGRWLLWLPVALGTGICAYFALPAEPPRWCGWLAAATGLAALGAGCRAFAGPVGGRGALLIGAAAVCLGFALAQVRVERVAAPVLDRAGFYRVEGRVADLAPRPEGDRVVLDQVRLAGVPAEITPVTIRVNLRQAPEGLAPGDRVRLRARLQPPLPPALPGAFDFARQAWFDRLGAIGFALGRTERLPAGEAGGMSLAVADLRSLIAGRIADGHPGSAGAVAAALVAGVRAGIDQETWRAMQVSGLAPMPFT
jgi:competence protein ComEC